MPSLEKTNVSEHVKSSDYAYRLDKHLNSSILALERFLRRFGKLKMKVESLRLFI